MTAHVGLETARKLKAAGFLGEFPQFIYVKAGPGFGGGYNLFWRESPLGTDWYAAPTPLEVLESDWLEAERGWRWGKHNPYEPSWYAYPQDNLSKNTEIRANTAAELIDAILDRILAEGGKTE